jgi:hypothetical protein
LPHSVRPKSNLRLQCSAWWPATRGRPEGRLGHGLAARSSHAYGPRAARAVRGHRAQPAHRTPWWRSRWRQGFWLEHHRHTVDAPGKKSGGGAHCGGWMTVGWWEAAGAAAFRWRAAPARRRHPQGGPMARDGGEGGAAGTTSERRRKHGAGERKPAGGGGSTLIARKNQIPSKEDHKFEFHLKRKFGLVS